MGGLPSPVEAEGIWTTSQTIRRLPIARWVANVTVASSNPFGTGFLRFRSVLAPLPPICRRCKVQLGMGDDS